MEADTTRVADGNTEPWAAKLCARWAKRASAGVRASPIRSRRRPSSTTTTTRRIASLSRFWDASSTQRRDDGSGQPHARTGAVNKRPGRPAFYHLTHAGMALDAARWGPIDWGPDPNEEIGHGYRHHQDDCPRRGWYRLDDLQSAGKT